MWIEPLLNKLPIMEEETLCSYLFRLFMENHYETPYVMVNEEFTKAELDHNQIREVTCETLSQITGNTSLYMRSYKSLNVSPEKENLLYLKTKIKCCPICIEKEVHQNFTWGFNLINVCYKHKVYLINKCSKCNKRWTMVSFFQNKCNGCGQLLTKNIARKVTNDYIINSQVELANFLLGNKDQYMGLKEINDLLIVFAGFVQLFAGITSFTQLESCGYKMKYPNSTLFKQEDIVHILADLFWLFEDFERRFPLILRANFQLGTTRETRRRRQNFEIIISSAPSLAYIIDAYIANKVENHIYLLNVPRNIKSYDSYTSKFIEKNYLTKNQIKKQFGIVESEWDYLNNLQLLKACQINNCGISYFIREKTEEILRAYIKEKYDLITPTEAASLLGVQLRVVYDFMESGILGYSKLMEGDKTISRRQINELLNSLNVVKIDEVDNKITISRCFEKYNTSGISYLKIISMIRNKGLVSYALKKNYKLNDLHFDPHDLANQIKEQCILERGYSLKQVSFELKCSEKTVLKYVEAGLLEPPKIAVTTKNRCIYRFNIHDVKKFKENFRSVEEIVKEYNVSRDLIRNAVYRGAIKNYLSGICRKTIVSKREFERYINRRKDY